MSDNALRCRELVVCGIVFILALKITIIPFLNTMHEGYAIKGIEKENPTTSLINGKTVDSDQGHRLFEITDGRDGDAINKYKELHANEIARLHMEYNRQITNLVQQHAQELSEVQSKFDVAKTKALKCEDELKRYEDLLAHEKKRLDHLLFGKKERGEKDDL